MTRQGWLVRFPSFIRFSVLNILVIVPTIQRQKLFVSGLITIKIINTITRNFSHEQKTNRKKNCQKSGGADNY